MSEEQRVECAGHGPQQATFVRHHLVHSLRDAIPRDFWAADEPRPDAWCAACEVLVNEAGEWDDEDEVFTGNKVLCGACHDQVKATNATENRHA
jgi:hypothetical protein